MANYLSLLHFHVIELDYMEYIDKITCNCNMYTEIAVKYNTRNSGLLVHHTAISNYRNV